MALHCVQEGIQNDIYVHILSHTINQLNLIKIAQINLCARSRMQVGEYASGALGRLFVVNIIPANNDAQLSIEGRVASTNGNFQFIILGQ